jgi:hypothetical protein
LITKSDKNMLHAKRNKKHRMWYADFERYNI